MFKKLKAFRELTRLENGLMLAASFVAGLIIAYQSWPPLTLTLAGCTALITVEMGAFALNDYFDVEVDTRNKRTDRPIVRGDITRNQALLIAVACLFVSGVAGLLVQNIGAILVGCGMTLTAIFYNYRLKEYGIPGNLYIAFVTAAPFLFCSLLFRSSTILLLFSVIAFFAGLGREIMAGIWDIEGDALRNVKTVARMWGEKTAKIAAGVCFSIVLLLFPVPFFTRLDPAGSIYYHNPVYVVTAAIFTVIVIYMCIRILFNREIIAYNKAKLISHTAFSTGIIAFLLPALM